MNPLEIPYFRDPAQLPGPIPTKEEIQAATRVIKGGEVWATRRVLIVGQHFLVKHGKRASRVEGENLFFVEKNLDIRAPLLYAMWREPDGELYIVMELIPGESLDKLWPNLSTDDQTLILRKLRDTFDQMRALPSPGFYGSVTRGRMPHALFWTPDDDPKMNGPFKTGRELILGLAGRSRQNWTLNNRHSYRADFYEKNVSRALDNYPSTFSHSDLLRKNVVVQEVSASDSNKKDYELCVVDWEYAGWYPAYWEYAVASGFFIWFDDDWPNVIESIIDPWCAEAAMMKLIIGDLMM